MTDSTISIEQTTNEPEPSDSLKAFGAAHKAFRRRAGYTQEQYAPLVGYQPGTIASIEQGRRFPPRVFVERAEEVLDAFGVLRGVYRHATREKGLASWFRQWAELEEQAISLYTFENRLVPGLLQTEAYGRSIFSERVPMLSDSEIEAQITARLARQSLLRERPNTAFSFIIEEHVLLRQTGGVKVVREQIEHVLEATEPRNVECQVLPMARGAHASMDGPIRLLETPENECFAYCEGQENSQFITDAKKISALHMRYAKLRSQALTPEDSRSLLQRMRGAL
ncbi:helix-turn-helix transcriptional regulator [Streptomyces sp. Ag109_G2-15]|uniref:helix-turn-helix domain-containing protein n=1 Tax=Streptomyces sp. Ag109_G2-15 TaxID=1938850 RepID=UPI000BD58EAB|nr:helix-turn-helix transcriptional regulator [Streptomyces sp. Ag109_G2-15]SOD81179.1 Helix-turn-helix domain-containing protein [Streptomyces sp. Ag109_G2-15]